MNLTLLPLAALLLFSSVAAGAPPARLYEVTTQTGMPHLDENLRYAVRREQRCLDLQDLSAAFWILEHESMRGCRLDKASEDAGAARYTLQCDGGHGTTGNAVWALGEGPVSGTLNVRLGGKNMTFYQRVTATPVGAC